MNITPACKLIVIFLALLPFCASDTPIDTGACPRPDSGSPAMQPADIRSANGLLRVNLAFRSQVDESGLTRYCYIAGNGVESPTLRVKPGDEVVLDLTNELSQTAPAAMREHQHSLSPCSSAAMTPASTNLHFHGLSIPPVCHQDDVIHTLIQPSQPAFQYRFRIPATQPPGLYWYHPHPHGYSEGQVLGGASGALIVEGIEKLKPEVAGIPERILVLRDQLNPIGRGVVKKRADDQDDVTGKDASLNFVPIMYPLYRPALIRVAPDQREVWRVLNASADTYFLIRVNSVENGQRVPLALSLVAMDGVPVSREVSAAPRSDILISPGGRAEFVLTTPHAGALSQLVSRTYDTGPDGAANPDRVLANIISRGDITPSGNIVPAAGTSAWHFAGLTGIHPVRSRKLYFSEDREDLRTPGKPAKYYITVEGKTPAVFDMNFKTPDITVRQGTVEDWVIENRAREAHVFHIHQLHFQLLARDGVDVNETMLRDTIDLPYWDGTSSHYPSVRLRMDFRAPEIVGTFLFHCHILEHEDGGMMGSVEVVKPR
jgi:FtsP/CotA-like multicopper oxidase with cupredoxin domain